MFPCRRDWIRAFFFTCSSFSPHWSEFSLHCWGYLLWIHIRPYQFYRSFSLNFIDMGYFLYFKGYLLRIPTKPHFSSFLIFSKSHWSEVFWLIFVLFLFWWQWLLLYLTFFTFPFLTMSLVWFFPLYCMGYSL